jgi:ribose transport system substrate-binding protein
MLRVLAAISILMILSGCTSAAMVVPTETSTPRPTVTPLRKANVPEVATEMAVAAETRAFLPTATPVPPQPAAPPLQPTPPRLLPTEYATIAQQPGADAKPYIPVISKGFQHQFWQAVMAGSERAAMEFKAVITFEGPETEAMVDKQVEMFQTALAKKPAAICLAAVDSKAFIPLLEKAKAANIPVIGFDSSVDSDIPVATVATNNIAAAAVAADHMAQLIGGSGEVAIIARDQTSRAGIDRVKGFVDQIKARYPNITIVSVDYGAGDALKSTDIAKAVIAAHPNLKGYFGANEGSIIGVLNAVKELNMGGKIIIIGYDSGQLQKDAIRSGLEAGAITQDPISIGYKCVEAAVMAMKGESLPKNIDTGFKWYDQTNIDDPMIAAMLYD